MEVEATLCYQRMPKGMTKLLETRDYSCEEEEKASMLVGM